MFGRSKPVVISYSRRRTDPVPRWLVLLAVGIAAGAGGLWLLQEEYLPPRMSATESQQLRAAFDQADAERKSLKSQLAATAKQLETEQATTQRQNQELAKPRAEAQKLRDDMAALIGALPADPRGGEVQVRAANFVAQGNALAYDVILTRDAKADTKPMTGVMQFSVLGLTPRGAETTVALKPVQIALGGHGLLRGSLPLPDGVRARQVTVSVHESAGSKALGMRVMLVR
jgi:hypothetical protein